MFFSFWAQKQLTYQWCKDKRLTQLVEHAQAQLHVLGQKHILSLLFQDISSELWCSTQKNVTGEHRESETEGPHQGGQREKSTCPPLTIKSRVSPRDSSETLWFSISRDQHSLTEQGRQWTRLCKAGGVQAERRGEAVYIMQNLVSHSPLCGDDCAAQGTSSILSLVIEWCLTPIKVMWDWYSLPCLSLIHLSNGEGEKR